MPLHQAIRLGSTSCLCRGKQQQPQRNQQRTNVLRVVSRAEQLNLQMIVDGAHATSSYFKHDQALFEAEYEFVHGPLCGPPVLNPASEGEIHYPYYEALGYVEPPKSIHCIWEIRVNRDRDLWLHFDRIKFASRHCDEGNVEIWVRSRPHEPFLSVCSENVSLIKELPILSSAELAPEGEEPSVTIQFNGRNSPTRAHFKIAWTELFHLPRNPDGTLMTSRLTGEGNVAVEGVDSGGIGSGADGCEFACPGERDVCIPARLVCNGVPNCPNVSLYSSVAGDEAPELCLARREAAGSGFSLGWPPLAGWAALLAAATSCLAAVLCLACVCRLVCCRHRGKHRDLPHRQLHSSFHR